MNKSDAAKGPDLKFCPGEPANFVTSGTVAYGNEPTTVVRELLQNSLDAGKAGGREKTLVKFELTEHPLTEIPGIESYRRAFEQAKKIHLKGDGSQIPDRIKMRVDKIKKTLEEKKCLTLYVLDNGIGLSNKNMTYLLHEGFNYSKSSSASTGSYGIGHMTALPASELFYLLYGGVGSDGTMVGSGHAIIASHDDAEGERRGKDGYFISDFNNGHDHHDPYIYPQGQEIPEYILDKLNWIKSEWGTGTVVAVSAFNKFREGKKESLWQMVKRAAACNFFASFVDKQLEVEVVEDGQRKKLNDENIGSVLEEYRDEKRRKNFISGSHACSAFEVLTHLERQSEVVEILSEDLHLELLKKPHYNGATRIDICRNGMWVTSNRSESSLGNHRFTKKPPFHCVVLLNSTSEKIHGLVRKAESPLHNSLDGKKDLDKKEKDLLREVMESIRNKLLEVIDDLQEKNFWVDDFLNFPSGGASPGGQRRGA